MRLHWFKRLTIKVKPAHVACHATPQPLYIHQKQSGKNVAIRLEKLKMPVSCLRENTLFLEAKNDLANSTFNDHIPVRG